MEHGGFKHEPELTANSCSGLLAGFELFFFFLFFLSQSNVNVSRRSLIMLSWGGGGGVKEESEEGEKKKNKELMKIGPLSLLDPDLQRFPLVFTIEKV